MEDEMPSSEDEMPFLLSHKMSALNQKKTGLEAALKESCRDLVDGKKPTHKDIFLLADMYHALNYSKNGWQSLDLTSKINLILNRLKEIFPTLQMERVPATA